MKVSIRRNVFETNSSSTHTLTICEATDFERWENGELLLVNDEKLMTKEEAYQEFISHSYNKGKSYEDFEEYLESDENYEYLTYDAWCDNDYLEIFEETHTTKSGDKIVAFGKYGYDG